MECSNVVKHSEKGQPIKCSSPKGMKVEGGHCLDCKNLKPKKKESKKWTIPEMQARLKELAKQSKKNIDERFKGFL